ncbi:MAG: valine--tRNA ligase [Nitrospinota bacterium]
MLDKRYDPRVAESKWYAFWRERGYFHAEPADARPPYSIVIPPPNVTGSLHMGHALNNTLQDILVRWKRMEGFNVCWMPGTDHAGIATQNVVEQELAREGTTRQVLGREAFLQRVWDWKDKYGGIITSQLARLGASCDWERERFTMDEGLSRAVREVFVRLYEQGLIYRTNYIINWCPRCHTALSDLEVEHRELDGHLYHVRYPAAEGGGYLTVATTRPETILGDTAVAVHPDDERHRSWVGREVLLPLLKRPLPVIADSYVSREFGTGALKITPGHDPNDFLVGLRHDLPQLNVLNPDATMNEEAGPYRGLDRFECRARVLEDLKGEGLLDRVEPHRHAVGHCYRCHTVVEPYLSLQWFVRTEELARPAIRAVEEGRIRIVPSTWENTYFEWMRNIRDWCISRQIWWGHRIPAWYCDPCGEVVVAREEPPGCPRCGGPLRQESEVLDTWFSSALWPFSTFGWPEESAELKTFYPTSVLVTGFDILFFWVARMAMMGLRFMGDVPFRDVYIHALVRDEEGQKMSKSRGNVIDPLEVIDRYGADALRFTLAALAAQGRDIRLSEGRIAGYRNFCNKLWNAARFVLMQLEGWAGPRNGAPRREELALADRWVLSRSGALADKVRGALEEYRFNDAAGALYQFLWHEYCDWYLEVVKPRLQREGEASAEAARWVLWRVLERTLRLLHPFAPFITEEIWQQLPGRTDESIQATSYPQAESGWEDPEAEASMGALMEVLTSVRNIRGELGIAPAKKVAALVRATDASRRALLEEEQEWICRLGKVGTWQVGPEVERPRAAAAAVAGGVEVFVPLDGLLDVEEEIRRLQKQLQALEEDRASLRGKLSNPDFLGRAPAAVVEKDRRRLEELDARAQRLEENLERLRALVA